MNLIGLPELLHSNIGLRVKLHFDGEEEAPKPEPRPWKNDSRVMIATEFIIEKPNTNNNDAPQPPVKIPITTTLFGFGPHVLAQTKTEKLVELTGVEEVMHGLSKVIPVVDKYAWAETQNVYKDEVDLQIANAKVRMARMFRTMSTAFLEGRPFHTSQEVLDAQFDRNLHARVLKLNGFEINENGRYMAKASAEISPPWPPRYTTYIKYRNPVYWSTRTGPQILEDYELGAANANTYTYTRTYPIMGLSSRELTTDDACSWFTIRMSIFECGATFTNRRMLPFLRSWHNFNEGHDMLRDLHGRYYIENKAFYNPPEEGEIAERQPKGYVLYVDPYEHVPEKCDICTPQTSANDDYIVDKEQLKTIFYRQLGVEA